MPCSLKETSRLGIIGSDSSHTLGICRAAKKFDNIKITHIYGEDEEQVKSVFEQGGFEHIAQQAEDMIGNVDAVMITFRDGAKHLPYAEPFLKMGIPIWIDKPFTLSTSDAKELINFSLQHNTPIAGGSYVKLAPQVEEVKTALSKTGKILSGIVCFPIVLDSEYGGIHFYSHHLIETMLTIFGLDVQSITTKVVNGNLVAIAAYPQFPVIMNYALQNNGIMAGVFGSETTELKDLDISGGEQALLADFIDVINNKKTYIDPNHFIRAVEISNAIDISIRKECEVQL